MRTNKIAGGFSILQKMKFVRPQTTFSPRPKRRIAKYLCLGFLVLALAILYFSYYYYYYASYWLLLRPLHYGFFQKIYCNTIKNCTERNLLSRKGNDYLFCSMMPSIAKRFYSRFFDEQTASKRKAIALISHWDHVLDPSLDVVFVFLDGEAYPNEDINFFEAFFPKMLYIGHRKDIQPAPAKSIYYPYLFLSFFERVHSPLVLTQPGVFTERKFFAAYLASNCKPFREKAFDMLYEFAKKNNLGEVHSLGRCYGSHKESQYRYPSIASARASDDFENTAVQMLQNYKYVMSFENTHQQGYNTEKIVNAFLANTVPIYWGADSVLEFINEDTFYYLKSLDQFGELLKTENFSEEKRRKLVETVKFKKEAYYYLSDHQDILPLYRNITDKKSLKEDISDYVQNWDKIN